MDPYVAQKWTAALDWIVKWKVINGLHIVVTISDLSRLLYLQSYSIRRLFIQIKDKYPTSIIRYQKYFQSYIPYHTFKSNKIYDGVKSLILHCSLFFNDTLGF